MMLNNALFVFRWEKKYWKESLTLIERINIRLFCFLFPAVIKVIIFEGK